LIKEARIDDRLVTNIDLAATLTELAGVEIPESVDGDSLVQLLIDPEADWREAILFEHWRLKEGFGGYIPTFTGIRTEGWKYVEYETSEKELYDLANDPYELENLAGLAEYATVEADLAARLENLRQSTGYDPQLRENLWQSAPTDDPSVEDPMPDE
jgi:arylsulfatase A-like enzyme